MTGKLTRGLLTLLALTQAATSQVAPNNAAAGAQLPELEALRAPYLKNMVTIQAYRETQMAPVTRSYVTSLERLEKETTAKGDAVNADLVKTERDRIDKQMDFEKEELAKMWAPIRVLYDPYAKATLKIVTTVQQQEQKQARQYLASLENLQRRLTYQKEIAKAALVDAERVKVATILPPTTQSLQPKLTPAGSTVTRSGRLDPALANKIADAIKGAKHTQTESSGRPGGNTDIPAAGALLVGFEFQELKYDKGLYMRSLRPYFMTREDIVAGTDRGKMEAISEKVMAKPGYAVAGLLTIANGKGLQVIFMKVDTATGRFDTTPTNSYKSKWIGTKSHDTPKQIGGDGRLVIGVFGLTGADADTIGLVQLQ